MGNLIEHVCITVNHIPFHFGTGPVSLHHPILQATIAPLCDLQPCSTSQESFHVAYCQISKTRKETVLRG
jgi:hypothetical protein